MRRFLAAGVVVIAAAALAAVLAGRTERAHRWSVLFVVAEPSPGAYLNPEGPSQRTPRLDRLTGAGVRLPLAAPELPVDAWLTAVLGGPPPARSVLRDLIEDGWVGIGAGRSPGDPAWMDPFEVYTPGLNARAAVDAILDRLGETVPARAFVLAVVQPATTEDLESAVGRLIDGAAPFLPPARTLVVVVDRGMRSAVLVAPKRPETLEVDGALGPEDLGATLAEWLAL